MATPITPAALTALAVKALAEDTVRYGRDPLAYPDTKGAPYIIAEAFGITSQEAREHKKAFMAAWRSAGGTAQVKRLTEQAKPAAPAGEVAAPAAQVVEIATPTPADIPEEAMALARAIIVGGGGKPTLPKVRDVARGIVAMNAAADATL